MSPAAVPSSVLVQRARKSAMIIAQPLQMFGFLFVFFCFTTVINALDSTKKACEGIWRCQICWAFVKALHRTDGEGWMWFRHCLLNLTYSNFIYSGLKLIISFTLFISFFPCKLEDILPLNKLSNRLHAFSGERTKMWMCIKL